MTYFFRYLLFPCVGLLIATLPLQAQGTLEKDTPDKAAPGTVQESAPPEKSTPEKSVPASEPDAEPAIPPVPDKKTSPPDVPMEAYGTAHPECMEWTDSCRTCLRDTDNNIACSTPGIACLPADISCKTTRAK